MMLDCNIPGTHTLERVEELQEFIDRFPESKLTPIFQREIDELWIIYDRVQELTTAPYHTEIHLRREKRYYNDNKVFYYLEAVKVYDTPGIETETTERTVYPGTDRRKAIADFEAYKKSHPGIIAVKDIEKGKWER